MLRAGVVPLEPYPGAMKPSGSLCVDCGAEVTPTLHKVKARGRGCKHCVGREVSAVSEERQRELDALMRAAGFRPIAPYPGSEKGWLSICSTCGDEVAPWWSNVRRGKGCSSCGRRKAWQARRDAAARRRATQSAESQPDPRLTETSP
jgi:DNA-directed RNA polymerase subunit RPC12/RpoP